MIKHCKPSLTIFTDASILPQRRTAGWGGWARGDNRAPIFLNGRAEFSDNTSLVELWAVTSMVRKIVSNGYFLDEDKSIVIQADNLHTLNLINTFIPNAYAAAVKHSRDQRVGRVSSIGSQYKLPLQILKEHFEGTDIVYLKHIKGHQGGKHNRSTVNEICDRLAREAAQNGA